MPRCPNPRCRLDYPQGTTQCTNPFCQCLLPEAVVAGRYRVETLIGMGGMGAVYRVSDTFEMTQVALKVLSAANTNSDLATAVERFRREARYAHQLRHKNIVPVLNFGQDGQLLYLVMPLVTGGTLRTLLKAGHPLPLQQVSRYLHDLADAVDAIHAHPQQIVHRDIKPSNLLLHQDDGRLVVADFGIARAMQQEKALTQRGWSVGTEHYVAPEQEQGKAQPSSDIYSMGVVVYQMLTGLLPFQAVIKSQGALSGFPAPSAFNPIVPKALDAVVLRAIEVEPEQRFQTAQAFVDAFSKALTQSATPLPPEEMTQTLLNSPNVIVRTLIPENPCSACGRENRSSSRFCRYCGHSLDDISPLVTNVCQVGYMTTSGQGTPDNEDMLLIAQGLCMHPQLATSPFSLFAIADGLRKTSDEVIQSKAASRLAIETVADVMLPQLVHTARSTLLQTPPYLDKSTARGTQTPQAPHYKVLPAMLVEQWVRDAVRQANQVIYHCNADYDTHIGSTLTVALLYEQHLCVASVGDSRAYHYSQQKGLQRITTDHTLAANLVSSNLLREDELYDSPKRHEHYRYLGQQYHVTVDLFQHAVEPDDLVLLCTDGLWSTVRDEEIEEMLAQGGDPQKLAEMVLDSAEDKGSKSNSSLIIAHVQ